MSKFFNYLQAISRVNGLGNALEVQWLFHCGMLFSSMNKWWGNFQLRHSVHEGIDITYYKTQSGKMHCFDTSIRVPAMDSGVIINICNDFLGQTLVVEHRNSTRLDRPILFAYAHVIPEETLQPGHAIKKEEIIARVCSPYRNPALPPHLHFSCFELARQVPPENLNWHFFSKSPEVNLIHPVFL
jgi:hypothetical protein